MRSLPAFSRSEFKAPRRRFLHQTGGLVAASIGWLASSRMGLAQDKGEPAPPASDEVAEDRESIAQVDALAKHLFKELTFQTGAKNSERRLTVADAPVLRWSNPTAGKVHGADFVVVERGIPRAYCSVYRWFTPYKDRTIELSSLTTEPILATRNDRPLWSTVDTGVAMANVPDAPAPAANATQRGNQMRKIASRFSVELVDTRGATDGVRRELRLLARPVFRYAIDANDPVPNIVDGAIFAFVEGTDPEALLVVEARKKDEALVYQFALVRRNSNALTGKCDGKAVWQVEDMKPWERSDRPYFAVNITDSPA